MKNSVVKLGLDSALGPLHLALCTWPFALCPLLPDNALNAFIKIQGEKKWQTYQFVRNQMDRISSKDPSMFTTPQATKFRPMIGRASRCAGAAHRQTTLSATART